MTTYEQCLKRERDRERKYRQTPQGAFEASLLSFDDLFGQDDESDDKTRILSDGGAGAAEIRAFDERRDLSWYNRCIKRAREKLRRHHPECVEVFNLVVKNGNNRKESIWALMSKKRRNGTRQKYVI